MVPSESDEGEASNAHTPSVHSTVDEATGRSLTPPTHGLHVGLRPNASPVRPVPSALIIETIFHGLQPRSVFGSRVTYAMRAPSEDQAGSYAYVPGFNRATLLPSVFITASSETGKSPQT